MQRKDSITQTGTDVIKALSKTTSLTQPQLQEAFSALGNMIEVLVQSNYCDNVVVTIPYIGKISFKTKKGRKAGTKYKVPSGYEKGNEILEKVVEEDEPDYLRLFFEFFPALQKLTREESTKRFLRKKNSRFKDRK